MSLKARIRLAVRLLVRGDSVLDELAEAAAVRATSQLRAAWQAAVAEAETSPHEEADS